MSEPKTNPGGKTLPAASEAGAPRAFKSKNKPKGAAEPRKWPAAPPAVRAAVDRPPQPFQRAAAAPALAAGAVRAGFGGSQMGSVTVEAKAVVPKGSYKRSLPKPAAPPPPPGPSGPVTAGTPSASGMVRVEVRGVPGEGVEPPNATRWRFPPPAPEVVDAAIAKLLAAAASRAGTK